MWDAIEARVAENDIQQPNPRRQALLGAIRDSGLVPNAGATKYMVGFSYGHEVTVVWELTGQAHNFFIAPQWRNAVTGAGLEYEEKPFIQDQKDGGRHSGLNRPWSFPQADCLRVKIDDSEQLHRLLTVFGNILLTVFGSISEPTKEKFSRNSYRIRYGCI
jgi:5-methylcytosine-specific restriction protein B